MKQRIRWACSLMNLPSYPASRVFGRNTARQPVPVAFLQPDKITAAVLVKCRCIFMALTVYGLSLLPTASKVLHIASVGICQKLRLAGQCLIPAKQQAFRSVSIQNLSMDRSASWGPTGGQQTRSQFSEFIQTRPSSCTCIWVTKKHEVCNRATMLKQVHMLGFSTVHCSHKTHTQDTDHNSCLQL